MKNTIPASAGMAAAFFAALLAFSVLAFTGCPSPTGGSHPTRYTITFDSAGGSDIDPITANEGKALDKPNDPVRDDGYTFIGWFAEAAGGTAYGWPYTLSADITMYAHWLSPQGKEAADSFENNAAVKEALEQDAGEIGLETGGLAGIEVKIDEALAEYAALPADAKEKLAGEKAKLDAVKEKIGNVNNAHDFQNNYNNVLAADPGALKNLEDVAALLPGLDEALGALNALPGGAKDLLGDEIAKLESLKDKAGQIGKDSAGAGDTEAADAFRTAHAGILGKPPGELALGDEGAVDAALQAYSGLGLTVKLLLIEEYTKLSGFKAGIEALKPNDPPGSPQDPPGSPQDPPGSPQDPPGSPQNPPDDPPGSPQDPPAPAAPGKASGLSLAAAGDKLNAEWAALDGATAYEIYYSKSNTAPAAGAAAVTAGVKITGTKAEIAGLDPGTAYSVWVRGTSAAGKGPWSDSQTRATLRAGNSVLSFSIRGASGTIGNNAITLAVPYDTADFTPVISLSPGAVGAFTGGSFPGTRTYRVSAENGAAKDYTVTVSRPGKGGGFTLLDPFAGPDASLAPFTLKREAGHENETHTLTLDVDGATKIEWRVENTPRGNETEFKLSAWDYTLGKHYVSVEFVIDGKPYDISLEFTVEE
jgi:uncharacterized repeat protein (TIGR02543 family)